MSDREPTPTPSQSLLRIRRIDDAGYRACEQLAGDVFGFTDREVIPAWEMYTVNLHGGITLGAYLGDELVGSSHAFPGWNGRAYLFSFGLAVKPEFRSQGIGRALKMAQRSEAREAGYELIRWNVDVLASGPIFLYLTRLGARITGYQPRLYDRFRSVEVDQVMVDWLVDGSGGRGAGPVGGTRRFGAASRLVRRVEIPWDHACLTAAERRHWQSLVRGPMQSLLDGGFAGVGVDVDRAQRRSFVRFERS
jgi:predicted GNAT superfamily acetyltransferase